MTINQIIGTLAGAFIFSFCVNILFGKMVGEFGAIGGWLATGFVVGTIWLLNHNIGLIWQSGTAWVDQATAVGFGCYACSTFRQKDRMGAFVKGIPTLVESIIGGLIAAGILANLHIYSEVFQSYL